MPRCAAGLAGPGGADRGVRGLEGADGAAAQPFAAPWTLMGREVQMGVSIHGDTPQIDSFDHGKIPFEWMINGVTG